MKRTRLVDVSTSTGRFLRSEEVEIEMASKQQSPRWALTEYLRDDDCQLPAIARQVGVALALYWMDERGVCNPSYRTIGEATALAPASVKRAVKALKDDGCLRVYRTGYGPNCPNSYATAPGLGAVRSKSRTLAAVVQIGSE